MPLEPVTLYHAEIEIIETTADAGRPGALPYQATLRIVDTRTVPGTETFHHLAPTIDFESSHNKALDTLAELER